MNQQPAWNEILRKWMAKNQVTQLNMATRLEVTEGAFAHWLHGRREPKIEIIQEIAKIMEISTSALIGEDKQVDSLSLKERELLRNYNLLSMSDRMLIDGLLKSLVNK